MSSVELLKEVAKNLTAYDIVTRVEFLGCKVRARLVKGYVLDIYYNQTLKKYSYTLKRTISGWDNAFFKRPESRNKIVSVRYVSKE